LWALRVAPLVLVSFAFFDEFASGVPAAAAFAVREGFGSDISALTLAVLVAPQLLSLGIEPALVLWAGRGHRSTALALALAGMALSLALAALAPDLVSFGLAFALYAPASGVALGLAEAALMDQRASERERALTQWTLAAALGDLAAPLSLWGLAALGLGWRVALGATALLLALVSFALFKAGGAAPSRADDTPRAGVERRPLSALRAALDSSWKRLRAARGRAGLLLWLCATAACAFMDEVLAVLVGLSVYRATSDAALVAQSLMAFTLGGCFGLVLLERRLKGAPSGALLVVACVGSALCFAGWITVLVLAPARLGLASLLLLTAGAFTSAHYPLTCARAYAALPEDSTLVAAGAQALGFIDLAVPLVLGSVADRFGVVTALVALLLQPVGILVAVALSARSRLQRAARGSTLEQ